jgi:hypothetical protein
LVKVATALHEEAALSSLSNLGVFETLLRLLETLRFHHVLGVSAIQFVIFRVNSWHFVDRAFLNLDNRRSTNQHETARNQNGTTHRVKPVALLLASSLMMSCSRAPSFDILGSYFPAWLICLALGVVLTGAIRWLLLRFQIGLVFPIVVYPSLTALFAFGMWLVFYG